MKCKPSMYGVITASGDVHHGFRCTKHGVVGRRFRSAAGRDAAMADHIRTEKKKSKQK